MKYFSLHSYLAFLKCYKWRAVFVFVVFAVSDALLAVVPLFIGRLVGAASVGPENASAIWTNVIVLVALSSLHDLTWRAAELSYMKFMLPVAFTYENGLFHKVISKPYPYFVGKFTGKIATHITTLRKELEDLLDNVYWNYVNLIVSSVAIVSILFSVNVYTGAIFVAGMALMMVAGKVSIKNSLKYEAQYTDMNSTKNGKIIDVVGNFVNVKSFHKELREYRNLLKEQQKVLAGKKRSFVWSVVFWAVMSVFVRQLIWPVTIVLNAWLYTRGVISIAELATLLSTILIFSQQIWELVWNVSQFSLRMARAEEAHTYLFGRQVIEVTEPEYAQEYQNVAFNEQLSLQGLKFAYPDQPDRTVLQSIDLQINRGEKVGIVGHSGSGKTTLVKLLLGYYDEYSGTILLDGQAVKTRDLLSVISYVPQDTTLFNRSIADNIAYAVDKKVTQKEIEQASKKSLSHEFVRTIPEQYEAVVGERGVKLSTGQRQRLSIARAMLQDRPLLILDEATSALDSENEALVQKSLENLWHDRAVISIAHRLSTLKKMDRIIVMDNGRIVEQGTINELLKQKGAFYDLWNHQVNGMIIDE